MISQRVDQRRSRNFIRPPLDSVGDLGASDRQGRLCTPSALGRLAQSAQPGKLLGIGPDRPWTMSPVDLAAADPASTNPGIERDGGHRELVGEIVWVDVTGTSPPRRRRRAPGARDAAFAARHLHARFIRIHRRASRVNCARSSAQVRERTAKRRVCWRLEQLIMGAAVASIPRFDGSALQQREACTSAARLLASRSKVKIGEHST